MIDTGLASRSFLMQDVVAAAIVFGDIVGAKDGSFLGGFKRAIFLDT